MAKDNRRSIRRKPLTIGDKLLSKTELQRRIAKITRGRLPGKTKGKGQSPIFAATASFGYGGSATVTVVIQYGSDRSGYAAYTSQSSTAPSNNSANLIAYSTNQPAGNAMGSDIPYSVGVALYIQLAFYRNGTAVTPVGCVIPASQVVLGTTVADVPMT